MSDPVEESFWAQIEEWRKKGEPVPPEEIHLRFGAAVLGIDLPDTAGDPPDDVFARQQKQLRANLRAIKNALRSEAGGGAYDSRAELLAYVGEVFRLYRVPPEPKK